MASCIMMVKQGHVWVTLFLLIIFFQIGNVFAQPDFLPVNHFGTDDGMSSSIVTCINQDQDGFIWVGTRNGLNRFDGNNFKIYSNTEQLNEDGSLPANLVMSMCIDADNRLYIGTNAGLSYYNPELDKIHNYKFDSTSCLYHVNIQARELVADSNGAVYIGGLNGLVHFNPESNTVEYYSLNESGINNLTVDDVYLASDGRLWFGSVAGLGVLNPETQKIKWLIHGVNNEDYENVRIDDIVEDQNGTIWAASYSHGLFKVLMENGREERLENFRNDPDDPGSISANRLLSLAVDKHNNIWIGAENDGVYCLNNETGKFKHYLSTITDPLVEKTYSGECLFFDHDNNLWIGTYANGLQIAHCNGDAIVSYSRFKGGDLSNTNNMVNAFYEINDSTIGIGTDGGGINILNKKTGFFTNLNTTNSELPSDYILSITKGGEGYIWLATWGGGIVRYNEQNGEITNYNKTNSFMPGDEVYNICPGNQSDLLIATFSKGLVHYFPRQNKWEIYNTANSKLPSNNVNVVKPADENSYYVGTNSGLMMFYPQNKTFQNGWPDDDYELLNTAHVYDVFVESATSVWVGTLTGLHHFNPKTGEKHIYTIKNGLPNNTVNGILKDTTGMFWFTTLGGLCRYDNDSQKFISYQKYNGLQGNEFSPRSVLVDANNNLYFGGNNGFSIIYPEKLKKKSRVPIVKLTGLEIFNKAVTPNQPGSPLKRIISQVDEIKLPESKSVLTFHFSVLDYTSPAKNQHAYMLENFDEEWIYCGTRQQATYTNLDPGKYTLRVKGANSDGVWNETGVALQITIVPPWYRTWWFVLILFLFFVAVFAGINYLRVKSLKQQTEKLELAVKNRTKELTEINATKDKLFAVIAHDLRNPFNVILGYTDVLIEGYHKFDEKMMDQILENLKTAGDSAFALLENLMNWSRSQRGVMEFMPKSIVLGDFIAVALLEIDAVAQKKRITIENLIANKSINVYVDTNMLLLIFRNLLTNAVKFSKVGGTVYIVSASIDNDFISLGIKDEGIGIEPEKVKSIFQPGHQKTTSGTQGEKGSGLGLMLCKEFIEKHHGRIWVESIVGEGSVFWFTVPLHGKVFDK